jgi:hypothetical protein
MPWLRVDIWHVLRDVDNQHFDLLPAMQQIAGMPPQQRLRDRGIEYSDFLEVPQIQGNQVFGEAARGRKVNLPGRLNWQTGDRGALGILPAEAVDEAVHFVYDADLRVLVTQRQALFRATAVTELLRDVSNAQFHIDPVLRQDKWNRVERMESIGKIEIAIEGPDHHPDYSGVMPSLNSMLDEAAEIDVISVELTLSMAHSRRSMDTTRGKELVNRLRREEDVHKLKVSGKPADGSKSETVDFMNDRLVYFEQAEYQGRIVDANQCRLILRRAIEQNREYLAGLL